MSPLDPVGFVIARVAREHGRSIRAVALDSYALTLWTYLQGEEARRLDSLIREYEQLRGADMIAVAFHEPKKMSTFEQRWRQRATESAPVEQKSVEQLQREADELWAQHHRSTKRRPVS